MECFLRDRPGPRAVINALERLAAEVTTNLAKTRAELKIAESQLRDFQVRIDAPFVQERISRYWLHYAIDSVNRHSLAPSRKSPWTSPPADRG